MPKASQLRPTIGTATRAHDTDALQPSEAFSAAVHTAKSASPRPSVPVIPYVVLLGSPPAASALSDSGAVGVQPTPGSGPP